MSDIIVEPPVKDLEMAAMQFCKVVFIAILLDYIFQYVHVYNRKCMIVRFLQKN